MVAGKCVDVWFRSFVLKLLLILLAAVSKRAFA